MLIHQLIHTYVVSPWSLYYSCGGGYTAAQKNKTSYRRSLMYDVEVMLAILVVLTHCINSVMVHKASNSFVHDLTRRCICRILVNTCARFALVTTVTLLRF